MVKNKKYLVLVLVMLSFVLFPVLSAKTQATSLNQAGVRLGRLGNAASTGNDLLVTFKPKTSAGTVAKVDVVFPTGFAIATGTPSTGTTFPATPASITAPTGLAATAAATSGTKDIMASGMSTLSASTLYGFTIPSGTVTNPSSAGQYNVTVCTGTASLTAGCASNVIDTTMVPVYIYGASANMDQVVVTGSVANNFSFALSANTDTIPSVDPTTIQTSSGVNMTVSTNSGLGYTAYIKSGQSYLSSANNPGTNITTGTFNASPDTVTAGTTDYGFVPSTGTAGSTSTGSIAYDGEYNVSDGTHAGSFNSTNYASFVSRNGYTNGDIIALKERVAVTSTIAAATDYTDTLTIVAAGNF
jgi:hypothetical protein